MTQKRTNSSWHRGYGRRRTYAGIPPPLELDWIGHWLTPYEFAAHMQRSYAGVMNLERRGTLAAFGIPRMRDRRGRLWIQLITDLT